MRAIPVACAALLTALLAAISPVQVMDCVQVQPDCQMAHAAGCCAPQSCCCHVRTPASTPTMPASVIPTVAVERSPLGLPVLVALAPAGHSDFSHNSNRFPLILSGQVRSLYTLSHAFLI